MNKYSEKTDGAQVEKKDSQLVWNYKNCDQELGKWQAKELSSQIEHIFSSFPIDVVQAKHRLEVQPKQLSRRKLLKRMIKIISAKGPVDFILYIGDDPLNEKVFNYMN